MTPAATNEEGFRLSASGARDLAKQFGTPLYVLDEATFRRRIREYRRAFQHHWPRIDLSYASKANSACALLAIVHQEGLAVDVASEGELRAALRAGVPASACHLHGNNKSREELAFAIEVGVRHVVIDHFAEIDQIAELPRPFGTEFVLRLAPGVDPKTHRKVSTGQSDTKFGFNIGDGSAERALRLALDRGLPVIGFHCHVGSQLFDPEAQITGGSELAAFARAMREKLGFRATLLNVGGGLGVQYAEEHGPLAVEEYNRRLCEAVGRDLEGSGLDPVLAQEPGRSLIADAGVTLYRVGVVKTVPRGEGTRTFVAVDGGLSDNPRPALYGARYVVEHLSADGGDWTYVTDGPGAVASVPAFSGTQRVTVSGKHCETDLLFEDIELPRSLQEGDLLQVLATGAYNASMASNYNRFRRPAMVLVRSDGRLDVIQRRETYDELLAREHVPEDLTP